jgi:hypothetical protein
MNVLNQTNQMNGMNEINEINKINEINEIKEMIGLNEMFSSLISFNPISSPTLFNSFLFLHSVGSIIRFVLLIHFVLSFPFIFNCWNLIIENCQKQKQLSKGQLGPLFGVKQTQLHRISLDQQSVALESRGGRRVPLDPRSNSPPQRNGGLSFHSC